MTDFEFWEDLPTFSAPASLPTFASADLSTSKFVAMSVSAELQCGGGRVHGVTCKTPQADAINQLIQRSARLRWWIFI